MSGTSGVRKCLACPARSQRAASARARMSRHLSNPRRRIAREFLDLFREFARLTFHYRHLFLDSFDMPPHRLIEKRRGLGRQPVQLVIGALLERMARLQHAEDFQLDALPQPAQLRELTLLAEVERRPSRSDACR